MRCLRGHPRSGSPPWFGRRTRKCRRSACISSGSKHRPRMTLGRECIAGLRSTAPEGDRSHWVPDDLAHLCSLATSSRPEHLLQEACTPGDRHRDRSHRTRARHRLPRGRELAWRHSQQQATDLQPRVPRRRWRSGAHSTQAAVQRPCETGLLARILRLKGQAGRRTRQRGRCRQRPCMGKCNRGTSLSLGCPGSTPPCRQRQCVTRSALRSSGTRSRTHQPYPLSGQTTRPTCDRPCRCFGL